MMNKKVKNQSHFSRNQRESVKQQHSEKKTYDEKGEKGGKSENQRVENDGAEEP